MTTPGIIEQLDRCLAFENELIATVGEAFYVWIADRARAAHPAPSVENEGGADLRAIIDAQAAQIAALDAFIAARAFPPVQGGADYEAKARQTTDWILGFMEDECSLLPECVDWADRRNIANAIVNALAQSAADERKRTIDDCLRIIEAEQADWRGSYGAVERIHEAIAALAEPKGEGK
jgi:hypothetical protein